MSEAASAPASIWTDMAAIVRALAAGGSVPDHWLSGGRLYVAGVTQAALDAAVAQIGTAPATPVPASVPLLAFLREAAKAGLITQADALAAARTGAVPASFEPVLDMLPPDDAFEARLAWAAMIQVERANPLLAFVAQQGNIPASVLDNLFRAAGQPPA